MAYVVSLLCIVILEYTGVSLLNINIENVSVEYSDSATATDSGETIVMLHGWGASKELYGGVIGTLTLKYRVLALDFPGFGGSSEPPEVWDVGRFADLVEKFISALDLKKVILIGHSFGGRVAIKLASREALPFEISRMILVDSAGILPKRGLEYKLRVGSYKAAKKLLGLPPIRAIAPNAIEKMQKKRGSADYAAASPIMRGCLVKAVNEDLEPLLTKIKQDTLLIWGIDDDATPLEDGKKMEKLLPSAGLAVIEGAGHFSWLDSPAVFDAVIRSYLNIG